jgi:hypothetical protein
MSEEKRHTPLASEQLAMMPPHCVTPLRVVAGTQVSCGVLLTVLAPSRQSGGEDPPPWSAAGANSLPVLVSVHPLLVALPSHGPCVNIFTPVNDVVAG